MMINSLKIIVSDIRILQIFLMAILLSLGVIFRDFSIFPTQIVFTFASGILTQFLWMKILRINVSYFSAIITCFGLSILLRSEYIWVHPLVICLVISSKFIFRINGKHIFNPAVLGLILGILFLPRTWVSPGQWGFELTIGIWILVFGFIVSGRAKMTDISFAFLFFYFSLLAFRNIFYGYRWDVWLHQLQNGTLIQFTFFMITDPKTIPNHKIARILYALIVSILAYIWAFQFYKTNNLIWALFLCSPLVILLDIFFKEEKYDWVAVNR